MSTKTAKRKLPAKLGQPVVKQSAKIVGKSNLDEARAVVSAGGNAAKKSARGNREKEKEIVTISSDSSSNDDEDNDAFSDEESLDGAAEDVPMEEDAEVEVEAVASGEEGAEPSFGDLVRANASDVVDVATAFEEEPGSGAVAFPTKLQPPSGASLGTVLAQALRTNDVSLLESCLHTTDVSTIRATIQRLDSPLAGTLLQKLAERLHRRPGRAGSLMVWVQWSLVTHGGYLATQHDLMKKLAGLNRVIEERAKSLQSLLALKGKLDMLEAQTELRRNMRDQRRRPDMDENDAGVIYVEGQESDDEEVDGEEEAAKPKRLTRNGDLADISDHDSEISEDMPNTNGVILDSEEEDESSEEDNFLDDEAEESDLDEDDVDHEDHDSQGEDEETDDGGAPPPKLQRTGGVFSKKR